MASERRDLWTEIRLLVKGGRVQFLTGASAPVIVGTALAYHNQGQVHWTLAILAFIAMNLLQLTVNLENDYFDYLTGADTDNDVFIKPFTGGSRVIMEDGLPPHHLLWAGVGCTAVSALIGLYLIYMTGWPILVLGIIGGLFAFFYTAPPLKFAYRGLGELCMVVGFGVLPLIGAYWVQTQQFSLAAALVGLVIGVLETQILWINEFQDSDADAAIGKRNLVVIMGRRPASKVFLLAFVFAYLLLAAGAATGLLPLWALLGLLSLPLAARAALNALKQYDDRVKLIPSNVATILNHSLTAILISAGLVIARCVGKG